MKKARWKPHMCAQWVGDILGEHHGDAKEWIPVLDAEVRKGSLIRLASGSTLQPGDIVVYPPGKGWATGPSGRKYGHIGFADTVNIGGQPRAKLLSNLWIKNRLRRWVDLKSGWIAYRPR